jgi:hypothetical protein
MHRSGKVLRHVHASTCFRIGSKLRCVRSTPTEIESSKEGDLERFARTGVNTRETMFPMAPDGGPAI